MKNILTSILLILCSMFCFGQETFQFNLKFRSQSTYQTNMKTEISMKIINSDNSTLGLDKIETKMLMDSETLTKTKTVNKNGDLPFELSYTKLNSKMILNSQEIPDVSAQAQKAIIGLKLIGIENEKGRVFSFDDTNNSQTQVKETYESLMNTISMLTVFPKEVFKVGDSYEIIVPYKLALQKGMEMELKINAIYKLTKLDANKAYFDVVMSSGGEINSSEQMKIVIDQYVLSGKMNVDRKDQNLIESSFSGPMNITLKANTMKIEMHSENKYQSNVIRL